MTSSILSILLACLCWGFVFVLPSIIEGFNPVEISLGRFFFYGLISLVWMLISKRELFSKSYLVEWGKASWFGLLSTVLCFSGMVFCVQLATPSISALIFALSPISIAVVGNLRKKEFPFLLLLVPSILILTGVVLANLSAFTYSGKPLATYLLGLFLGISGLLCWTWYAVSNSQFFQSKPKVSVYDFSLMMGASTFFIVCVCLFFLPLIGGEISKFFTFTQELKTYLTCSFVLGSVSTWLAFVLWNVGVKKLPISIAGQLLVTEVVFGLMMIYFVENRLPHTSELFGIIFMLLGVILGCRWLRAHSNKIASA